MKKINRERLYILKDSFRGKRIAVIGDMMLDGYYWGEVTRISPEAPVPVVAVGEEFFRFGGAANVAYNILKLGAEPYPVGITGQDNENGIFQNLLREAGITSDGIIGDPGRPTTVKTRVIAGKQHVVRIDKESKDPIGKETEDKILELFAKKAPELDAVILQDYNKGVLTKRVIHEIIEISLRNKLIITVDPKFDNFFEYQGVTVFKPNRKETEDALGIKIRKNDEVSRAGQDLLKKLNPKYALLTLGEAGIALFGNGDEEIRIPTKARKVADVSGAGDTVISTLTVALSSGADITEAAYLANFAGGLVCEEVGIIPIEADLLFSEAEKDSK